jgi:hypothetical protein
VLSRKFVVVSIHARQFKGPYAKDDNRVGGRNKQLARDSDRCFARLKVSDKGAGSDNAWAPSADNCTLADIRCTWARPFELYDSTSLPAALAGDSGFAPAGLAAVNRNAYNATLSTAGAFVGAVQCYCGDRLWTT